MTTPEGVAAAEPAPLSGDSLIAALSELATRVQRCRTADSVLETAGVGVLHLGLRLVAFQLVGEDLVVRYIATAPSRLEMLEREIGRPLRGLRAPLAGWELVREVVALRGPLYRENLGLFDRLLRQSTGYDSS